MEVFFGRVSNVLIVLMALKFTIECVVTFMGLENFNSEISFSLLFSLYMICVAIEYGTEKIVNTIKNKEI